MTLVPVFRWATVAVCGWAAVSIATRRRWTVSYTIDRLHRAHPWAPYVAWVALGAVGVWHGHDMRRGRA